MKSRPLIISFSIGAIVAVSIFYHFCQREKRAVAGNGSTAVIAETASEIGEVSEEIISPSTQNPDKSDLPSSPILYDSLAETAGKLRASHHRYENSFPKHRR